MLALKAEGKSVGAVGRVDVYGVPLGETAKLELAKIAAALRNAGGRASTWLR